jgi:transcriptional regulator with XRE-family HTH domain
LGLDIKEARRRRQLPMSLVAERAFTSRTTLQRIEEGDPAVSAGIYAAVLQALGLLDNLAKVADPAQDAVGQAMVSAELPKRVRWRKAQPGSADA